MRSWFKQTIRRNEAMEFLTHCKKKIVKSSLKAARVQREKLNVLLEKSYLVAGNRVDCK